MCKKFLAMVMTVVMFLLCIPTSLSAGAVSPLERVKENYQTVVNTNEVISSTEIEGIKISCRYVKSTKEYYLKLEDEEYKLNVSIEKDDILFDIADQKKNDETYVYGQNPAVVGLGLFAPEMISAIESCLICVTGVIGITETTYLSLNIIDSISNSSAVAKINTGVADAAISVSASSITTKTEYDNSYFEAKLSDDGTIFIGKLLAYKEALIRLRNGYDIMSVDGSKAYVIASAASPVKKSVWHAAHPGPGVRYDHYHPMGIKWYKNTKYHPHVWYL